jgi:tRNA (Thr-GGU) A37 N-methylase
MKTTARDVPRWLPYVPRLYYRDAVPVDPDHIDGLRERDLEQFVAHGRFARHVIPREFTEAIAGLDPDSYVVVSFAADRWHRQLATQHVTLPKSRRKGKG